MANNGSDHTSLLDLPPEILSKVISYMVEPSGRSSIQSVLRACRQLYDIALPFSVSVFRNTVHHHKGGGPCSPTKNAQFLHYLLISKPWLARHVNTVILGGFTSTSSQGDDYKADFGQKNPILADSELAIYQKQIENILGQISPEDEDHGSWCIEWISDLKKGCSDAQVSLILLICPNIQTLLFEESKNPRHFVRLLRFLGYLSLMSAPGWSNNPILPLSNLEDVFHETNNIQNGYTRWYEQGPLLFTLPRLRYYECNIPVGNERAGEQFGHLPPKSSSIEEITLRSSSVIPITLSAMLRACKALRKLEYTSYTNSSSTVQTVAPRDILDAILLQADSLAELYINTEEDWDKGWGLRSPNVLYMGMGLRKMAALRKLTVGMQCLTGLLAEKPSNQNEDHPVPLRVDGAPTMVDCLPENLEYLKIHSCSAAIHEQAQELLAVVESGHRFKNLTYISLLFNSWLPEKPLPLSCNAPNVHLDIGYQTQSTYQHDLGHPYSDREIGGRGARNVTSRIHASKMRKEYLATRGITEPRHKPFYFVDDY
ncbi:unnamed protein product [Clonostachys chloroleuca]|uniref:F-box domain-containing protein n=1 Tax=Clonostachys chloroleuca TaxID=1926264 RepID=A0AA35VKS5_9HYPO|nr:unnamed protein product [Clonostachys chloroleuca]